MLKLIMKIINSPSKSHLNQLAFWLEVEQKSTGGGFFCNWGVIVHAYENKTLSAIELNSEALGFLAWHGWAPEETINILSIHPKHRSLGMGGVLVKSYLTSAKCRGVKRVKLECEPYASESFWRTFGFLEKDEEYCSRIDGIPMERLNLYLAL